MLIEPTPQERARDRNAPTRVIVATVTSQRVLKPEHDTTVFDRAALEAFNLAAAEGYAEVAYISVSEFISAGERELGEVEQVGGYNPGTTTKVIQRLSYRYVWEFTAHKG